MTSGKVEALLVVSRFDVREVQKPDLSTNMSISRKVTWKGKMVQVNQTG